MADQCWATVCDAGPTLTRHRIHHELCWVGAEDATDFFDDAVPDDESLRLIITGTLINCRLSPFTLVISCQRKSLLRPVQQPPDVQPMLVQVCATVIDLGPTSVQRRSQRDTCLVTQTILPYGDCNPPHQKTDIYPMMI